MRHLRVLVLASLVLARMAPLLSAEGIPQKAFEIVKLAEGVYGFQWKNPVEDPIEGNALFIINDHDVLVVDTGLFPSTARRMAAQLRKLTDKPVRYVVNTHWHDDHHLGNQAYRDLWPGVEFIAHRDTRADLFALTYAARPKDIAQMEEGAAKYARWAAEGIDDDGKPLEERRRKRAAEVAEVLRASIPEFRAIRETPPELTFDDELVLRRGEREIRILWLGRGNTRGDTIVFLPKERIAAIGDLLVQPVPFGIGSYYEEWIATLARLDALEADVFFPGHGGAHRDRVYLRQMQALLRDLVSEVKEASAAGISLEETQRKVTLSDWKTRFAGDDPALQRAFEAFFVQPGVERAWRQARGDPEGESPAGLE